MAKVQWKPGTLLYPLPAALVSCGTLEHPNALTIAWTGIICSDPPMTYISVRPERYSYELIKQSGEFVINVTHPAICKAVDYCGVKSGRDVDKFAETGLVAEAAKVVRAPLIAQCPISLECKVEQILPLGSHSMFLAKIVSVDVREDLLDEKGLHLDRSGILAYVHGAYCPVAGKPLGRFGYSVRKRPANKKKQNRNSADK